MIGSQNKILSVSVLVLIFTVTLIATVCDVYAQTYILQGEKGDPGDTPLSCSGGTCTLDQNLTVDGNLLVIGQCTTFSLTVNTNYTLPACPEGYTQDLTETSFILCERGSDQMVRVGNIWIDRYEVSAVDASRFNGGTCDGTGTVFGSGGSDNFPDPEFPDNGNFQVDASGNPIDGAYACSISGNTPSRMVTWFQAQAACALAGKYLCTNEEWQMAAEGTVDPGLSSGAGGLCITSGGGARATGQGSACISNWGTEDMIGNLAELTSSWFSSGMTWQSSDGQEATPWPTGYGNDATLNVNGRARSTQVDTSWTDGMPSVPLRGGAWANQTAAGIFTIALSYGPSAWGNALGFRCCKRR